MEVTLAVDRYQHLLATAVQQTRSEEAWGSWRRVGNPEAVPFNYGYPYPGSYPLAALTEATARVLTREGAMAMRYGGGEACRQLSRIVEERLRGRGMEPRGGLLITNGSAQALALSCQLFLDAGDWVAAEGPTYMGALRVMRNHAAQVLHVDMDDDGLCPETLREKLESRLREGLPQPKFLYTIPNFQNPSGCTMTEERRRALLELAEEYDFMIVEDDAYGELRFAGDDVPTLFALDRWDRVIYVGSMSKVLAPGVRLGWMTGPEPIMRELMARKVDGGTNPFAQSVVAEYWSVTDFDGRLHEIRRGYRLRRDAMLAALVRHMPDGCSWTQPEGGFFVWVALPQGVRAVDVVREAEAAGAQVLGGGLFYADGRGGGNLRLSFSYPEPEDIDRGIQALGDTVKAIL